MCPSLEIIPLWCSVAVYKVFLNDFLRILVYYLIHSFVLAFLVFSLILQVWEDFLCIFNFRNYLVLSEQETLSSTPLLNSDPLANSLLFDALVQFLNKSPQIIFALSKLGRESLDSSKTADLNLVLRTLPEFLDDIFKLFTLVQLSLLGDESLESL